MKGRLYNSQASLRLAKLADPPVLRRGNSSRPAVKYFWKSSIPPKWTEILGPRAFAQCCGPDGRMRNSLAFLEETQKYISQIYQPIHFQVKTNGLKSNSNGPPQPRHSFAAVRETSKKHRGTLRKLAPVMCEPPLVAHQAATLHIR